MAADFFYQQDVARKKSGRLVLYFIGAVVGIVLLVYAVVAVLLAANMPERGMVAGQPAPQPPYLAAFVLTAVAVTGLIGLCSLYKITALRSGGGESVAQAMGGRLLHPDSAEGIERKILNVVEEMALASGTPVPPVYMMDREAGINAFAAGYAPESAVIGITRGAAEQLTRDELQGVVAHEFAHILNGDMRLNIRLMGVIFGIIALAVVGRVILHASFYSSAGRGRKDNGGALAILAMGVALLIIGGVGVLFGRLIQAAVSRQREFLADASAVQFTRNPDTIGGALKRIGGVGSRVRDGHAEEISHMFIASAATSFAFGPFATHPPIEERIKRIDPAWDGTYPDPKQTRRQPDSQKPSRQPRRPIPVLGDAGNPLGGVLGGAIGFASGQQPAAAAAGPSQISAVQSIGQINPEIVAYMRELIEQIPEPVKQAAHEPYGARAVVFNLLLDRSAEVRGDQLRHLTKHADEKVVELTRRLSPTMNELDPAARLPLIDMAVPALRELSDKQYTVFRESVEALVKADGRVDLFEWSLERVLVRHLDAHFVPGPDPKVRYYKLEPVKLQCATLLSVLAHVGNRDAGLAGRAFAAGQGVLQLSGLTMMNRSQVRLDTVGEALDELSLVSPREKKKLIAACATTIASDGEVTRGEGELMRAVADALGVPMPPLLPGQRLV